MSVKSTTQMTKAELLEVINDKNRIIAELNEKIDDLSAMAVASQAKVLDADTSRLLSTMSARIKDLEAISESHQKLVGSLMAEKKPSPWNDTE